MNQRFYKPYCPCLLLLLLQIPPTSHESCRVRYQYGSAPTAAAAAAAKCGSTHDCRAKLQSGRRWNPLFVSRNQIRPEMWETLTCKNENQTIVTIMSDSCQVSMNQPCSKACCCWCRGTCVRYHHISAPARPERGRSSSSSELRVDTVRCRYASRFTWTFFFPFALSRGSFRFFRTTHHEIDCHGTPKSDWRGDFPPAFSLRILRRFERGLFCCILHIPIWAWLCVFALLKHVIRARGRNHRKSMFFRTFPSIKTLICTPVQKKASHPNRMCLCEVSVWCQYWNHLQLQDKSHPSSLCTYTKTK